MTHGYTDEQKRRKAAFEQKEFENLPWSKPIEEWENHELTVRSRHSTQAGIQALAKAEKKITE